MKKLLSIVLFLILCTAANAVYVEYTPIYSFTHVTANTTTVSSTLRAAVDGRRYLRFVNTSATTKVTIVPGTTAAVYGYGINLDPLEEYEWPADIMWQGAFQAISSVTNNAVIDILEGL